MITDDNLQYYLEKTDICIIWLIFNFLTTPKKKRTIVRGKRFEF